jgi:membrane protease YdiL (CAAX protease family)
VPPLPATDVAPDRPPAPAEAAAARRELWLTWATAIGGLALARLLSLAEPTGLLAANLAGVAAFLFVWLPDRRLRARDESWAAHGAPFHGLADARTWRHWGRGAALGLATCAVVVPLFLGGFALFAEALPRLPAGLARLLAPYAGAPAFDPRLPDGLPLLALVQLLVVALPEELFYRGWMQTRWARTAPGEGITVLGARLGRGFLWTQLLFAAGHLISLQPWRLGTFFPGLLFGWLRERTGSIAAPVVVHALSNLFMVTLERSFYG